MNHQIEIGRLLRAGTTGFTAGCRVSQFTVPALGSLVRASLGDSYQVYGLIYDIHIDDDGLVRQPNSIERSIETNLEPSAIGRRGLYAAERIGLAPQPRKCMSASRMLHELDHVRKLERLGQIPKCAVFDRG